MNSSLQNGLRWAAGAALLAVSTLAPTAAHAGGLSRNLDAKYRKNPNGNDQVRVIVQFSHAGVDSADVARQAGGKRLLHHGLINGATLTLPVKALKKLQNSSDVAWVSEDEPIRTSGVQDYARTTMSVDLVSKYLGRRGDNVSVAVLDTGIAVPADLATQATPTASRLIGWKDFVNGQPTPYDDNGHGTHVAGIVVSSGKASNGQFVGGAPDSDLVAVKVLDGNGGGNVSNVINGLDWCVQNKGTYNIRVINLSLGHQPSESYKTDPLCAAVRRAVQSGIVVVVAAGNTGKNSAGQVVYGGISSPGNEPTAITVGASNTQGTPGLNDDTVATYSSRGPCAFDQTSKPDVVAPGNKIVSWRAPGSLVDVQYPGNQVPPSAYGSTALVPSYYIMSGTSMAAPEAAAVASLAIQSNRSLTPNLVKAIMMYTAVKLNLKDALGQPLSAGQSLLTQGAGLVNALGVVEAASKIDTTKSVGNYWLKAPFTKMTLINGQLYNWGCTVDAGNKVYTGDALLSTNQVVWSDQVVWNDDDPTTSPTTSTSGSGTSGSGDTSGTSGTSGSGTSGSTTTTTTTTTVSSGLDTSGGTVTNPNIVGGDTSWSGQVVWTDQVVWSDQCVWSDSISKLAQSIQMYSTIVGDQLVPLDLTDGSNVDPLIAPYLDEVLP